MHITLFLVHFNSFEVIRSQSLQVWKNYQNNQVTSIMAYFNASIKKLLGVSYNFSFIIK